MNLKYLFLILLCCSIFSCKTAKHVSINKEVPAITENRLFKNIYNNELDYNTLFAKRIDISLSNRVGSDLFSAVLRVKRDSFIQVSLTLPLGLEVARVLFTNDSIKFVDLSRKKYFITDYSYFHDKYDIYVTYNFIQSVLTNTFFNLDIYGGETNSKKYKLDRTDQGYELSTVEERSLSRKIKKLYKKRKKNKDFILVLHKILVNPQYFRPTKVSMEDIEEGNSVSISYQDFNDFSGKIFPGSIILNFTSETKNIDLKLKFKRIDFDVPVEHNLRISSKYKKMNL